MHRLTPDSAVSRTQTFHMVFDETGAQVWVGRYLTDLIDYVALHHPQGVVAHIEETRYKLTVELLRKDDDHGQGDSTTSQLRR